MDFRSLLQSLNSLSEGDVSHRAGPGGYGNRHGSETQTDQYGKPIGKVSLASLGPKDDKPKRRGPPVKPGSKTDLKNKEAEREKTSAAVAGLHGAFGGGKMPSKDIHTGSKKHSLKEYIEEIESNQQLDESNQGVTEGAESEVDATLAKIAASGGDGYEMIYDGINGLLGGEVQIILQDMYDDVSREHRLHPDDDYEQIQDYMMDRIQNDFGQQGVKEVAPPGAKAERMVKDIEQSYAKDGELTPKEKSIAYATAWKAHNRGQVEEDDGDQLSIAPAQQTTQVIKQGDKVLGSVTNPQLAAQVKQAIGQGQMTLNPTNTDTEQEMAEDKELSRVKHLMSYGKQK